MRVNISITLPMGLIQRIDELCLPQQSRQLRLTDDQMKSGDLILRHFGEAALKEFTDSILRPRNNSRSAVVEQLLSRIFELEPPPRPTSCVPPTYDEVKAMVIKKLNIGFESPAKKTGKK